MKNNRNFRRMLSILLVLALLLPCISIPAFSQDLPCAEDGCSGKYRSGICSAAGHLEAAPIEDGIYRISNAGQLFWFAELVNGGEVDADAALTADITLDAGLAWTPIGLYTSGREYVAYAGTFDGAGYTIYGLTYDNTAYNGRNAGFVGTLDASGTVKDLTIAEANINGATEIGGIVSHNYGTVSGCAISGAVTGTGATGGIVCRNMGTIENCFNEAVVTGATVGGIAAENNGTIDSCSNAGVVSGTSSVAGIAGMNDGTIADSVNTAAVTASNTHVGGIAGNHLGGEITGCGNTGAVTGGSDYIGGVAGACLGAAITESYNSGSVTGADKSEAVGGVVGAIDGTNTHKSTLTSVYNTGKVTGRGWVGGIAGISGYQKTPMTVEIGNSYNTGSVTGTNHTGAVVGKLAKGTVSGTYFLTGSAQNTVSGATAVSTEEFVSGEIAAKLNETSNVWYQTLDLPGLEPDASPVLDDDHGTVYYGYCDCTDYGYTNRENYNEPGDHVDEDGDMICDKCGTILGEVHEHEFGEWERTKEPTCAEYGEQTRICSICNYPQKQRIEKLPHTEELIPGTPATFDEPGMTDGKKCSVCGEIIQQQEVAPVRDYNEGIIPLNTLKISCGDWERNGGASEGPAELAVDDNMNTMWHTDWYGTSNENHWFQFELTEDYLVNGLRYKPRQTGNSNGTITGYEIQVSNDGVNFETIASGAWANDRTWKVVEFDAQDVKYVRLASTASYCDNASIVCASAAEIRITGYKAGEQPHEHAFGEWTTVTAPTCTEKGEETRSCECGEVETREIAALGHDFVNGDCKNCDEVLTSKFEDVPAGAFYFDPVEWAVAKGVTTGATETTFNPNGDCQRAQVVTFLWRAAGSPEPTSTNNPFKDVKPTDFYYKAVLWAVEQKITNGLTADTFGPFALCNRAQVVTFLWRAMGSPASTAEVTFTDVEQGKFYTTAVAWAVENNITNGISATEFGVDGTCNRAQVVTFLYRAYQK